MSYKQIKAEIDAENARIRMDPPEEVVKVVHYRIIDSRAGTDDEAFTTWFFACTDVRYVDAYLYNILRLSMDPKYSTEQIKTLAKMMVAQPAEFAGYCGFHTLWKFAKATLQALDETQNREEVLDILNSLRLYASNMNAWIHHYMPWKVNFVYPHQSIEEVREAAKLVDRLEKK
jgi:hypothetical protein